MNAMIAGSSCKCPGHGALQSSFNTSMFIVSTVLAGEYASKLMHVISSLLENLHETICILIAKHVT